MKANNDTSMQCLMLVVILLALWFTRHRGSNRRRLEVAPRPYYMSNREMYNPLFRPAEMTHLYKPGQTYTVDQMESAFRQVEHGGRPSVLFNIPGNLDTVSTVEWDADEIQDILNFVRMNMNSSTNLSFSLNRFNQVKKRVHSTENRDVPEHSFEIRMMMTEQVKFFEVELYALVLRRGSQLQIHTLAPTSSKRFDNFISSQLPGVSGSLGELEQPQPYLNSLQRMELAHQKSKRSGTGEYLPGQVPGPGRGAGPYSEFQNEAL